MKGLLTKEKYVMWHNCGVFLLIPLFFFTAMAITLFSRHSELDGFPVGMVYMFMGIIPVNISNTDIQSKWHLGCLTMPYTRRQVVASKYICGLILVAGVTVAWVVFMSICAMLGAVITFKTALSLILTGCAMGLLPSTAILPFSFKWYDTIGGKRIVLGGLAGGLVGGANVIIMNRVPGLTGSAIFFTVMVVAFFISWLISNRLFERKDV